MLLIRRTKLKSIPPEIFQIHSLQKLDIGSNQIESLQVPSDTNLNLNTFFLDHNKLTRLPDEIKKINAITFDVSGNNITTIDNLPRALFPNIQDNEAHKISLERNEFPFFMINSNSLYDDNVEGNEFPELIKSKMLECSMNEHFNLRYELNERGTEINSTYFGKMLKNRLKLVDDDELQRKFYAYPACEEAFQLTRFNISEAFERLGRSDLSDVDETDIITKIRGLFSCKDLRAIELTYQQMGESGNTNDLVRALKHEMDDKCKVKMNDLEVLL